MIRKATTAVVAILLAVCALIAGSCDSGYECGIEKTSYNRIKFYNIDENNIESEYSFPEVITVSLIVNGEDSIVINHLKNATDLKLFNNHTEVEK